MYLPEKVKQIIEKFQENGYEAYAVGGCVRDSLLSKEPDDWDITTNASPEQMKRLFRRTVDTGIEHGTVTVLLGDEGFEVTTYRIDGSYEDGRHPKEVTFTTNLKEDLRRRDFTINAMAYNHKDGLVDCFGGKEDLEQGIIRCVGNATERFTEDALRILRCVRFSAQLGFDIEEETAKAANALSPNLQRISAERIQMEWSKLLVSEHVWRVKTAYEEGILKQFFPEITVTDRLIRGMELVEPIKALRYALFFCELDSKMANAMLRRLKFDNDTIKKVTGLVKYKNLPVQPDAISVRKAIYLTGEELFPMLLQIWKAYTGAGYSDGQTLENISQVEAIYKKVIERGDCLSLKDLAVSGKDLIAVGVKPGKEMGDILNHLLQTVLEDPDKNKQEMLLEFVNFPSGVLSDRVQTDVFGQEERRSIRKHKHGELLETLHK